MEPLARRIKRLVEESTGYSVAVVSPPTGGLQAQLRDNGGGTGATAVRVATLPCPSESTAMVALVQEMVQHQRVLIGPDKLRALVAGYGELLGAPGEDEPPAGAGDGGVLPLAAYNGSGETPALPGIPRDPGAGSAATQRLGGILAALGLDARAGSLQVVDARAAMALEGAAGGDDLQTRWMGPSMRLLDAQLPLVVTLRSLSADPLARARVVDWLATRYPATHPVVLIRAAGSGAADTTALSLTEVAALAGDTRHDALYLPPLDPLDDLRAPNTLGYITARLRAPGGCPWDREQTPASLTPYMLEEAHEAVDAIERGDAADTVEELGDVLLQVVLHSQLAEEEGRFSLADVAAEVNAKLVRRHPHVFGDVAVSGSSEVLRNWESIKRAEKGERRTSVLDGVPRAQPALLLAQTIGRKAAKVGFDWPDVAGTLDKAREELDEIAGARTEDERREELGDLFFALTSVCRHLGVDAEQALRAATRKFETRFRQVEALARERGLDLSAMDIDALEALWQEVKARA